MSTHPIGIDLGTTRSAVSYIDESGRTAMVRNADDDVFTPSVVFFEDDSRIVGREAVRRAIQSPSQVAIEAKRHVGLEFLGDEICGKKVPPEAVQGCVLRSLRGDILRKLGSQYSAVVTVPAYFDETRRTATVNAAKIAELKLLDIVNEPTAAALAFGEKLGYLDESGAARTDLHVLVYDLGGGTFDVTIVRLEPQKITTVATGGDMRLGGFDWDKRLVELIAEKLKLDVNPDDLNSSELGVELRRLSIEAKHTLSNRARATVEFRLNGRDDHCTIDRQEFESRTRSLLERTSFTTRQTLSEANLTWTDINRVLLVGGSTRMPMVRELVEMIAGKSPDVVVNPDEAVARGAAIFARHTLAKAGFATSGGELTITDVNAHSLGIEGINTATGRKENTHVIPRNTPLPHVVTKKFVTKTDDQTSVVISVLEGEGRSLEGCLPLGRAVIRNLPRGLKKGHPIRVEYSYNTSGRLSVRGRVDGFGDDAIIELHRTRELSSGRLAAWKRVVCKDGGFSDFEAVLDNVLHDLHEEGFPEEDLCDEAPPDDLPVAKPIGPEGPAATPYGAPLAAAVELHQHLDGPSSQPAVAVPVAEEPKAALKATPIRSGRAVRSKQKAKLLIQVAGHLVFSILGLFIGYWLLVWIRPDSNFLNLPLPGLSTIEKPASEADNIEK